MRVLYRPSGCALVRDAHHNHHSLATATTLTAHPTHLEGKPREPRERGERTGPQVGMDVASGTGRYITCVLPAAVLNARPTARRCPSRPVAASRCTWRPTTACSREEKQRVFISAAPARRPRLLFRRNSSRSCRGSRRASFRSECSRRRYRCTVRHYRYENNSIVDQRLNPNIFRHIICLAISASTQGCVLIQQKFLQHIIKTESHLMP